MASAPMTRLRASRYGEASPWQPDRPRQVSWPQLRFVLDWEELHRDELMTSWDRAGQGLPLVPIDPLRKRR
jgi:hypothetical protein